MCISYKSADLLIKLVIMKVLILAGGLGTRLGEETAIKPKPMVEIGRFPILWHIMKIYSHYGHNEFVILTGYKHEVIKNYFIDYFYHHNNITIDLSDNSIEVHSRLCEPWKVSLVYTGEKTLTAGRVLQAQPYCKNERFLMTYGDAVSDINITELIKNHEKSGKIATLTAYQPSGRFGALNIGQDGTVETFLEKPKKGGSWINAGFFVCEPDFFEYIPEKADAIMLEDEPLRNLTAHRQLNAFTHEGFWHPMDMLKDKIELNKLWSSGSAPWKIWD